MNKYILDSVKNNIKTIFSELTVPQKKSMTLMIKRLFQTGSGILRHLGDGNPQLPKTIGQKFSHHLGNINLLQPIEDFSDRQIVKHLSQKAVIAYDLTDIAKPTAKKIENITLSFDGSQRRRSHGFFVHGVGFGNLLWRLRMHDNTRNCSPQIRKEILTKLIKLTKTRNPIFALDRGNDDRKLFEFLSEKSAQFIVRLKCNRYVILKATGEKKRVDQIQLGRHRILITKEGTEQRKKPEYDEYQLVIFQKQKSKKSPIRLLFSNNLDSENKLTNKQITNLYLQRWGVENSFKQIKSTLNLEDIRVLRFQKFQNFVSLQHFCCLLNELLFVRVQKNLKIFQNISLTKIFYEYKKFLKRYTLTVNSHSFFRFLQKIFPTFFIYRKKRNTHSQTSLFHFLHVKPKTF